MISAINSIYSSKKLVNNKQSRQETKNSVYPVYKQGISSTYANAQKAAIMPAISFGSLQTYILEYKLNRLIAKYSSGEDCILKSVKADFVPKLVRKIQRENTPLIIGMAGLSGSKKSTLITRAAWDINELSDLGKPVISVVLGDHYYKDLSDIKAKYPKYSDMLKAGYSMDEPKRVDLCSLSNDLRLLSRNQTILTPSYDFVTSVSTPKAIEVKPRPIVIADSIFALRSPVVDGLDVKIYLERSPDARKEYWYNRTAKRGTVGEDADMQFADVQKQAQRYVIPTKDRADIVLNGDVPHEKYDEFFRDLYQIFA